MLNDFLKKRLYCYSHSIHQKCVKEGQYSEIHEVMMPLLSKLNTIISYAKEENVQEGLQEVVEIINNIIDKSPKYTREVDSLGNTVKGVQRDIVDKKFAY